MTLDIVTDEAHLQRRLRVFHHGRRHHYGCNRVLSLVVELHPAHDTAASREFLQGRAPLTELNGKANYFYVEM